MPIYGKNGNTLSKAFNKDADVLPFAYNKAGAVVFSMNDRTNYDAYTFELFRSISVENPQGMEIYGSTLFQFRGSTGNPAINNLVSLYDFQSGEPIAENIAIQAGHANAVSFGEKLAPSDEYPVIYDGDWFGPIVHANKITGTTVEHLFDIVYDEATAGYHSNPCFDNQTGVMYTVGYFKNTTTDPDGNYCILCAWDVSNMTDNGDGTFTPTLKKRSTRDFIYVMQDVKYNAGYIWISSGLSGTVQNIYAMNPDTGAFDHVITGPITSEIEGLSWHQDEETGLFFAYIGFAGGKYYKVTFEEI